MNNHLAPSKSTVYLSNLPYNLTNNDLHQLLQEHGKIARVTIVKDKETRKSKGVAFVLFLKRDEAASCIHHLNGSELYGRKIKASLAHDNGRAPEFIRRREYPDKSRCYECGEFGHLSYKCVNNHFGDRDPPIKKRKRPVKSVRSVSEKHPRLEDESSDQEERTRNELDAEAEASLTWSSAISQNASDPTCDSSMKKRRICRDSYFSDEEFVEGED